MEKKIKSKIEKFDKHKEYRFEAELTTDIMVKINEIIDYLNSQEQELDKARREYFSMGMEYFSLIDDSNIYQKKGWKLSEEKAERLQILDKMFNLLKDNK